MKPIRIVVADDSLIARDVLQELLERDGDIEVVGTAADGNEAIRLVEAQRPHLVTMDIEMPGMDGFQAIEQIMARHPVPILVVTAQPAGDVVFQAVRRGALEVAEKPRDGDEAAARLLRAQVRRLSVVPVIPHVAPRTRSATTNPRLQIPNLVLRPPPVKVVGIASSAGGPGALAAVLAKLPADLPACVPIVQHLPVGFLLPFVEFLRHTTKLQVEIVRDRLTVHPGVVLLPADDRHLLAAPGGSFYVSDAPPVGGHRPSATALFQSLARVWGPQAVGVVLTGIGSDGAAGLLELRNTGALTIAQDEASSVVYGMPKAAKDIGAARQVLPLDNIPSILLSATRWHEPGGGA